MATDSAVVSVPTDGELEAVELALHGAIEETLADLASRVNRLLNQADSPDVTVPTMEQVGQFVFWLDMFDLHLRAGTSTVAALRESINDLAIWAHNGELLWEPAYDEHGSRQRLDDDERWRNDVSRQLGIERYGGGWHPEHAKAFAASMLKGASR